jgi:uncharacterized protein (DUF433 family)
MTATKFPHIEVGENGVPWIEGSQTKVIQIILDRIAYHWDADEIQRQHPHLTLSQIYSALAYYHDNQAKMDRDIQQGLQRENELLAKLGDSPLQEKLRMIRAERLKA